uniref:Putative secreted protein n=1 Tax=Ixodes ricinus TaxID=34613 RepID=A0A090X9I3_IXORI
MIAALFLAIQLLGQSQSEICEGDFPNATEVMTLLTRTYMFQSFEYSPEVQCAYQIFYYPKVGRNRLQQKYDKVTLSRRGNRLHNPLYITLVVNSTIHLSNRPELDVVPTQLDILYSDLRSCMVTKGPYSKGIPQACRLWMTESFFANPSPQCTGGFERHCKSTPLSYNITGCINLNDHH